MNREYNLEENLRKKIDSVVDSSNFLNDLFVDVSSSFTKKYDYHNYGHCLSVANDALSLFGQELVLNQTAFFSEVASSSLSLLLAGLYHDAGYQGHSDDSLNIQESLRILEESPAWSSQLIKNYPSVTVESVSTLVRETQYPHKKSSSILSAILQDSDILQTVLHPSEDMWRLSREQNRIITQNRTREWLRGESLGSHSGRQIAEKFLQIS
jgi:hypothetical protein